MRIVRACVVGISLYSLKFLSSCLALRISMGLGRSSTLRIRGGGGGLVRPSSHGRPSGYLRGPFFPLGKRQA